MINWVAGGDVGHAPTAGSPALSSPAWMHPKRERFGAKWWEVVSRDAWAGIKRVMVLLEITATRYTDPGLDPSG